MKKKVTFLPLCAMLFAFCGSVDAQQPTKIPRIGYLVGIRPRLPAKRHSGRVCSSRGTRPGKTLSSSGEVQRAYSIASPRLRPN